MLVHQNIIDRTIADSDEKVVIDQVFKNIIKNLDLRLEKKHRSFKAFNELLAMRWYLVVEMQKFQ